MQEYCNGGSLSEAVAKGCFAAGALQRRWQSIIMLLKDIAEGLDYIHACRICHGDLSPSSVLLKVCDRSTLLRTFCVLGCYLENSFQLSCTYRRSLIHGWYECLHCYIQGALVVFYICYHRPTGHVTQCVDDGSYKSQQCCLGCFG